MEQLKLTNLNFTNKWNECQSPYNLPLEVFCLCGFSFLVKGIEKEIDWRKPVLRYDTQTDVPQHTEGVCTWCFEKVLKDKKKKIDAEGDPTAEQEIEGLRS